MQCMHFHLMRFFNDLPFLPRSNSRPAVFYVGNREGSVSIWDLMDRSNGPVITQPVSNVNITGL